MLHLLLFPLMIPFIPIFMIGYAIYQENKAIDEYMAVRTKRYTDMMDAIRDNKERLDKLEKQ